MEYKLKAGVTLDILNKKELADVVSEELSAIGRGFRFRRVPYSGSGETVTLDGPESGFVWSIKLLSASTHLATTFAVYINEVALSGKISQADTLNATSGGDDTAVFRWSSNQFVVYGGESVIVRAFDDVDFIAGVFAVEEAPVGSEWKL
jgi:hypothetical protein